METEKKVYDNCELFDRNGNSIGYCNKKRFNWYIIKGLAKPKQDNPNGIELLFEPKFKKDSTKFMKNGTRKNICYVCGGEKTKLVKFRTVPIEYKTYMPLEWKSHNAYDILSLCEECAHYAYQIYADKKHELMERYNINERTFTDSIKRRKCILARNLIGDYNDTNNDIINDIKFQKLREMCGYTPTYEQLKVMARETSDIEYEGCKNDREYIIKKIIETEGNNGIKNFFEEWKQYFIDEMDPLELPEDFFCINYDH